MQNGQYVTSAPQEPEASVQGVSGTPQSQCFPSTPSVPSPSRNNWTPTAASRMPRSREKTSRVDSCARPSNGVKIAAQAASISATSANAPATVQWPFPAGGGQRAVPRAVYDLSRVTVVLALYDGSGWSRA